MKWYDKVIMISNHLDLDSKNKLPTIKPYKVIKESFTTKWHKAALVLSIGFLIVT